MEIMLSHHRAEQKSVRGVQLCLVGTIRMYNVNGRDKVLSDYYHIKVEKYSSGKETLKP